MFAYFVTPRPDCAMLGRETHKGVVTTILLCPAAQAGLYGPFDTAEDLDDIIRTRVRGIQDTITLPELEDID